MNEPLLVRRTKMLNYVSKGVPLQTIVTDLSTEFKRKPETIYKDYERMATWAPQILTLKDDKLAYSLVNNIKQIIPNAWYEYTQADNSSAKIGALRLIMEATLKLAQLLQSLGKMEKVVEAVRFEVVWLNDELTKTKADTNQIPTT